VSASETSPARPHPPSGCAEPRSKARRLFDLYFPYLPDFPLDEDDLDTLDAYPGELPTDLTHYYQLLAAERAATPRA